MSIVTNGNRRLLPERRALADEVYDAVLGLLMDQVIAPGERASIDGIARELGVSPTPVREALARLESEGLVLKQPRKGYTAAETLDAEGLRHLYEMRRLLEPFAASKAAGSLDSATLKELEQLCEAMEASGSQTHQGDDRFKDYKAFAEQDADFHRIIAEHAGNGLLADAIGRLRSHTHQYRIYFTHVVVEETSNEHNRVLEALRAGDSVAAEAAMAEHLSCSYRRIDESLKASQGN